MKTIHALAVAAAALACVSISAASVSGAPPKQTPKRLGATVKKAIAAEKRALKAFDSNKAEAKQQLQRSPAELQGAAASSALDPSLSAAASDLKQAVLKDSIAIDNLGNKRELDRARAKINEAIVRKEGAAEVYGRLAGVQPVVSAITATFDSDAKETVYKITASDPRGDRLLRVWTLDPKTMNDPPCHDGFAFDNSRPNEAIWHHSDSVCNHSLEDARGHVGVVTVAASDTHSACTTTCSGTVDGAGEPAVCKPGGSPG